MTYSPAVLHPVPLPSLLEYLLSRCTGPITVVICSSQEVFLRDLLQSIEARPRVDNSYDLLTPTLQLLKRSRTIKMAFCSSLQVLHAWLCSHSTQSTPISNHDTNIRKTSQIDDKVSQVPMLIVVNPIALHRETSAFSAQGLSRAFAAMVEAAAKTRRKLLIAECPVPGIAGNRRAGMIATDDQDEGEAENISYQAEQARLDPWDEDVSILNVTTKSFGAGERGWAGRTVKIGQVAGRWCRFESSHEITAAGNEIK